MASPHAAGAAALYLQARPSASPATVANKIVGSATEGVLTDIGSGSPNRLLYAMLPVEVDIQGPDAVPVGVTETWEAMPHLGDGTYTYQWTVYWHDTGSWEHLGTAKTQSLYVGDSPRTFDLSVTVASAGDTAGSTLTVNVHW